MRDDRNPNTIIEALDMAIDRDYKWVVTADGKMHRLQTFRQKSENDTRTCFGFEPDNGDIHVFLSTQSYMDEPYMRIKQKK